MDGWSAYEKMVLDKLDTIDDRLDRLEDGQTMVRVEIATLKVKAGLWGGAFGIIPALVMGIALYLGGN